MFKADCQFHACCTTKSFKSLSDNKLYFHARHLYSRCDLVDPIQAVFCPRTFTFDSITVEFFKINRNFKNVFLKSFFNA